MNGDEGVGVITLGARGLRYGIASAVVVLVLMGLFTWWQFDSGDLLFPVVYAAIVLGSLVWTVRRHRLDTVRLGPGSMVVVSGDGETAYPWEDVLEVSWSTTAWPYGGSGPVLRLRGGPYEVPGPNAPAQVAQLPVFGRAAVQDAVRSLEEASRARGIPYTPKLLELINSGKRMPRLPGETWESRRPRS